MINYFNKYIDKISKILKNADTKNLENTAKLILKIKKDKKKIIIVGNGGSAAIASHVSIDFTKAANIRSINFNEADLLTCFSNDFGYENWVAKALEFYADKGDLVILISSSGTSKNIINGAKQAKKMNCSLITFSGFKKNNPLSKLGIYNFWVDSKIYNFIENVHQVWLLSIVDRLLKVKL